MAGHPLRPATRHSLGGPLPRQRADRPRAPPLAPYGFPPPAMQPEKRMRDYPAVGPAIPHKWAGRSRVTHPFAGQEELPLPALDLHVLSTPPAFVLSQDQTLQENSIAPRTRSLETRGLVRHASGINKLVIASLAAAHESRSSTRAIARMSHSIVKQQQRSPCFRGTLIITVGYPSARG